MKQITKPDIDKVVIYCCKKLRLQPVKVKIIEESFWTARFNCDDKYSVEFNPYKLMEASLKDFSETFGYKFTKKSEAIFFVIAHEMGHYLQHERYYFWLSNYMGEVEKYLSSYKRFSYKKYNSLKVEANANRIALALLRTAKKEKFKFN